MNFPSGRPATLAIKVEADAGDEIINVMFAMYTMAQRTGCRIECRMNGTLFWVRPENTWPELSAAYDRLYPESGIIAVNLREPVPRHELKDSANG
jgi:hypothetical protein